MGLMAALLLAPLVAPGFARATSTITVVNADAAGEGFNDPTPVAPVGGNTGTTLGAQRLIAFQRAADIWGNFLNSSVEIRVRAQFNPLFCDASSAVLGSAGPNTVHADFTGRPLPNTWYPAALANKLHGSDLCEPGSCSATDDMSATFNSTIGTTCPLPVSWYYGLDASPPGNDIDLVTIVAHELAHGLGFLTFVDLASGQKLSGLDDTYMLKLEDHSTELLYPEMTNGERVTASKDTGDLHWVGPSVVASSGSLSAGVHLSGHVEMYAPNPQEPGSSVSHFSDALSPDEVMEPFYTGPNHDPGLAVELMIDIGWSDCGDGLVALGEGCDDGNLSGHDGCDGSCQIEECWTCAGEPSVCSHDDGASCDDDKQCTINDICAGGVCNGTPTDGAPCDDGHACTLTDTCQVDVCVGSKALRVGCRAAQRSILIIRDKTPDMNDRLLWKWIKGESTSQADFADPAATAQYALCLYGGTTGTLVAEAIVPPHPSMWQPIGTKGYKYLDKRITAASGIQKILLKGSSENKAKVFLKGKGYNLPTPELPLSLPATAQLVNSDTGICWESTYDTGDIKKNEDDQFKAKAQTP